MSHVFSARAMRTELLARIDAVVPSLPGWCTVEKAHRLAELCVGRRMRTGVELGVFGGRSLVAMAFACAAMCTGNVDGIDPYDRGAALEGENDPKNDAWWSALDYEQVMREAVLAVEREGLGPYARVVRKRSVDAADDYPDGTIDVLHQDSNHSEAVSCAEVRAYAPKMSLGSFWIIDDTDWPTTARAQALLAENGFRVVEEHATWSVYQLVGTTLRGGDRA